VTPSECATRTNGAYRYVLKALVQKGCSRRACKLMKTGSRERLPVLVQNLWVWKYLRLNEREDSSHQTVTQPSILNCKEAMVYVVRVLVIPCNHSKVVHAG